MSDYYKTLGLEPDAGPQEIKKAYFSLVRRYSPEKDPEKFREIREAYEQLQKSQDEGPSFPEPSDRAAAAMLKQILKYRSQGDVLLTRDACEEALYHFPDERQFLFLLASAQRAAGNTGNAVKSCEKLVKMEPENKWFWREYAIACMERGFTRKAYAAFERAYELGCRDNDFILTFATDCLDCEQYDTGLEILFELVRRQKKRRKEEIIEMVEAFSGLLTMNLKGSCGRFTEIMECLCEFMQLHSVFLDENAEGVLLLLLNISMQPVKSKEEAELSERAMSIFERSCKTQECREDINALRQNFAYQRISNDRRIGETLFLGYEALFTEEFEHPSFKRFALLDVKLCMIEEREEVLPQLQVIREEYPAYYEAIRDFAEQLKTGRELDRLKNSLLKQYVRLAETIEGGTYFEKYPEQKVRSMGRVINEGDGNPYVRAEKKISRNAPCPCGSGKKYKYCCGR